MRTRLVEVTNGWGKFLLGKFDAAEDQASCGDGQNLVRGRGWSAEHLLVLDLQTGEGALFRPGGLAAADLDKHRVWVCPMFQPFLELLYAEPAWWDLDDLPQLVTLPDAASALWGYRRPGPEGVTP